MKETFLHYLWKFKKFNVGELQTYSGEPITIIHVGQYLELAGPDFFNAQITIGDQKWAGNVEIHVKSSDWYLHHHEMDSSYENVILHVVWEHDIDVFRSNNVVIPVLELKNYVDATIVANYHDLTAPKSWIYCENSIRDVDGFKFENWQERLFFERLERKAQPIFELLDNTNQDWEAVLFCLLAKNFGLNTNGDLFFKIAQSIQFSIVRKESFDLENLEALLLGFAGLLDMEKEDVYFKELKFKFYFLIHKYKLDKSCLAPVQFFKHRPDNFPTIRLSQLANLYHLQQNLFSKICSVDSISSIYQLFQVHASAYWVNHYQFDKVSPAKKKLLSKSFIDLIVINTIIPLQFAYAKSQAREVSEDLMRLVHDVSAEKNTIIDKFKYFGIEANSAFETQSLLQLKSAYCNHNKCLDCVVGMHLMQRT